MGGGSQGQDSATSLKANDRCPLFPGVVISLKRGIAALIITRATLKRPEDMISPVVRSGRTHFFGAATGPDTVRGPPVLH